MAQITIHDSRGELAHEPLTGAAARSALRDLGVRSGAWALQVRPVSKTPQLTYARELRELQQQQGAVLTDRVRQRPTPQRGDPRDPCSGAWSEPRDLHSHADAEVRVLLEGRARYVLQAPAFGGWVAVACEAGDWLALPAGLPHTFEASTTQGVELLRLFARAGGWLAERTGAELPRRLQRWEEGVDPGAAAWARAA